MRAEFQPACNHNVSAHPGFFLQLCTERDTVKMYQFVLLLLIFDLLKNEVHCGPLGKISRSHESLIPMMQEQFLKNISRINLEFPLENEIYVNVSRRVDRSGDFATNRRAKFFPKIAFLAGLNIGGGLATAATATTAHFTKAPPSVTTQGPLTLINPYVAALYDPYPYVSQSYAVQQSIIALYNILDRLKEQMNHSNHDLNDSVQEDSNIQNKLPRIRDNDENIMDDRTRQKDKLKSTQKRKEEMKDDTNEEEDLQTDLQSEYPVVAKAAGDANMTTNINSTTPTNITSFGNGTYPQFPGYYGGYPQGVDQVGITYDQNNGFYSPPYFGYGLPSQSYGSPFSGPPSQTYGPPSYVYGSPQPDVFHDPSAVIYDDPTANSFAPAEPWLRYPGFGRSTRFRTTTQNTPIASSKGFVPVKPVNS